jgi:DNA invertase Pin-like site-specific DNA recombinase
VLARLLDTLRPGDTLVVAQLDRLARSVSHLLAVIEQLEGQGAFPLPTRSDRHLNVAGDVLSAGVGAVAQFERALIAERTKAGLKAGGAAGSGGDSRRLSRQPGPKAQPRRARTPPGRDRRSEAPACQSNDPERFRVRRLVGSG